MADINAVAKSFTDFYYNTFDGNRSQLASLYRQGSMLSWEGQQILGSQAITEKLTSLPFAKVQHRTISIDAQPGIHPNSVVVLVTGQLLIDDETNPQFFTEAFTLVSEGGNSYYVYNDIFRLVLG